MPNLKPQQVEVKNPFMIALMEDRGWKSLYEMSEETGINIVTLSRYAQNEPKAGAKLIENEAKLLGVDPGDWLKGILGLPVKLKTKRA